MNTAIAARPQPASGLLEARLRVEPEDFEVVEIGAWQATGAGEHALVWVEKRGANSAWVADELARRAGVGSADIGYCGLKDRHAVTRQWFSVRLPGASPQRGAGLAEAAGEGWRVLEQCWHERKLRRGDHAGNRFRIRLRQVALTASAESVEARLQQMAQEGVPNYFGPQRFGRGGSNLDAVRAWLADGSLPRRGPRRGLILSAARAHLFNRVLAARVADGSWARVLPGEAQIDGEPSGPLWGRGRPPVNGEAARVEDAALTELGGWCAALEHVGLQQQRRPLILRPQELCGAWEDAHTLLLEFGLPAGAFATAVLEALGNVDDVRDTAGGQPCRS